VTNRSFETKNIYRTWCSLNRFRFEARGTSLFSCFSVHSSSTSGECGKVQVAPEFSWVSYGEYCRKKRKNVKMQKKEKMKNKMLKPVKKVKKKNTTKDAVPDNKLPNIQTLTFPSQMCT